MKYYRSIIQTGSKTWRWWNCRCIKRRSKTQHSDWWKNHYQKVKERLKNIEKVLKKESLLERESNILKGIYEKLKGAIEFWEQKN